MKYTKLIGTGLALILCSSLSYGQIGFYFSTGYHGGAFKSNQLAAQNVNSSGDLTTTASSYSLGGGIPINLGVNIPLMDYVSFDFGLGYWLGSSVTAMDFNNEASNISSVTEVTSNQIRLYPGLKFTSDAGLYSKIGLVVPVGGKTTSVTTVKNAASANPILTYETTGVFSMGAFGSLGYGLELSDNLSLFGEIQMISLHLASSGATLTDYKDDAGTSMDDLPESVKTINYNESLDKNSNVKGMGGYDVNKPEDQLRSSSSFGAFGFNIGIAFTL